MCRISIKYSCRSFTCLFYSFHESLLSYYALLADNKVYLQQVIFIIEFI